MSRRPRRTHSAAFKAKVALAVVRGGKTLAELGRCRDRCGAMLRDARILGNLAGWNNSSHKHWV
jgi:transposase-like protein